MNPKQPYPALFEDFHTAGLRLSNRIVALPVYTGYARPDGTVSPMLIEHYTRLAQTGAAMVVVANVAVAAEGIVSRYNLRIDGEEFVPGLTLLAKTIRTHGAVACLQLNHAGRFARTDRPLLPSPIDRENLAFNVASLKHFMNFFPLEQRFPLTRYFLKMAGSWRRAVSGEDCRQLLESFGSAAQRAFRAGFDAVELHGAGGYLLCQFLSAFTNKSEAQERLPFQDRIAFPLAVIRQVRRNLPDNFPIGIRLMVNEWVPGGIDLPEAIAASQAMEQERVAYFSVSAGTYNSIFAPAAMQTMAGCAYLENEVKALSAAIRSPVIISGRIITPETANRIVSQKVAPLVGLGRPLRTDGEWLKKASVGQRKITTCFNCNWCLKRVVLEQGFSCKRWSKTRQLKIDLEHSLLSRNFGQLWVVARDTDLDLFKRSFIHFLPHKEQITIDNPPTVLLLDEQNRKRSWKEKEPKIAAWGAGLLSRQGLEHVPLKLLIRRTFESCSEEIKQAMSETGNGYVIVGRDRREPWRERLLYDFRGKVVAVLGTAKHPTRVLVPVDLSRVTALILAFLQSTYLGKEGFDIQCVHVLEQPLQAAERKWSRCLRVAGLKQPPPIHYLAPEDITGRVLVEYAEKERFGTIMMGKRGLSRIKRWLLGSVSAQVLRNLTDQSLFLID
jgi:2,4-dienoyl-CoA reductase (NADPH2)